MSALAGKAGRRDAPPSLLACGLALTATLTLGSCAHQRQSTIASSNDSIRSRIYARANLEFAKAVLHKPAAAAAGTAAEAASKFAPLILQEMILPDTTAAEPQAWPDRFGRIGASGREVDPARPTIYFRAGRTRIHGRAHEKFTYVWAYPATDPAKPDSALLTQGVRITLDSAGRPAIWEALADPSGLQIIFVSQSLEAAAAAEFGPPLAGRRFSVERDLHETPGTVVARIVDDGPVPMGPILYLRAGTREVGTMTCRCMPDQAKNLLGQDDYELAPMPAGATRAATLLRTGDSERGRLERRLRLPGSF